MDDWLKAQFKDPGAAFRSLPFWAWNGKLSEEEIRRQIRELKEAGAGGFFMHSRVGLETEYLGEAWMRCVRAAVDEAKAQGLYAWLYDEDRWPSGTAGGRVTAAGDAYRLKGLTLEICDTKEYPELFESSLTADDRSRPAADCPTGHAPDDRVGLLAVFAAVVDGEDILRFRRLPMREGETFSPEEVLLAIRLEVSAPSEWFNSQTPPDNLNPDCVQKFIAETHEKYKQVIGEEFGKTVPGIFTDEPSLNDRFAYFGEHKSWIPWTFGYSAYFEEHMGYDFLEVCPLFYFHGEGSPQYRHDYWRSITQRYGESYFQTLSRWCEENGLLFTGHFLQEDKLGLCTRVNGAVMPNYQYMHVPGVDMLCEQTGEYLTVKQCTGAARQTGKKRVITETYGCTGWDFTFAGQKWMGDWQYVLGVNRRCQHLMLYSLRGCRKRDYPPDFNYQNGWWRENKAVEDYFARLSLILERGDAVRNILLLHPASTAWSRLGVNPYGNPKRREERDVPAINQYGDRLNALIEYLEREHLDVDLGDELLIEKYGSVEAGAFVIGQAGYQAVVLPPMDTLLVGTWEKLAAFMEQGGYVYAMEPGPCLLEGRQARGILAERLTGHPHWIGVKSEEALAEHLEPYRTVRIEEDGAECRDVLYQLRKDGEEYYLFLVNNNRNREAEVTVKLPFAAAVSAMELLSGEIREVSGDAQEGSAGRMAGEGARCENGAAGLELRVHLPKTGSALFCLGEEAERTPVSGAVPDCSLQQEKQRQVSVFEGPFAYTLHQENVLPLDLCRYRMGQEDWSEEQEVWSAQKRIREALQMRPIHHNGIRQRYQWAGVSHPKDGCPVELTFCFVAAEAFDQVKLALERPEDFQIFLNGTEISWQEEGYFLDREIPKSRLPRLREGINSLLLRCRYRNDMELENIYLTGRFGVDEDRRLTALPEALTPGSFTEQGLKHYCGSVSYQMEYALEKPPEEAAGCAKRDVSGEKKGNLQRENVRLKLTGMEAVCVKLWVNGHRILLPWNFEQEVSIGDLLFYGKNRIEVEAVASLRNAMGPFHLKEKPHNTHDASFCASGEDFTPEYVTVPYGLTGKIVIIRETLAGS